MVEQKSSKKKYLWALLLLGLGTVSAFAILSKKGGAVPPTVTHKECVGGECLDVDGEGADLCSGNADCIEPPINHTECQAGKCVVVGGAGANECSIDGDCPICTPNELDCKSNGLFKCSLDGTSWVLQGISSQCKYKECENNLCVEKNFIGNPIDNPGDSCLNDNSCAVNPICQWMNYSFNQSGVSWNTQSLSFFRFHFDSVKAQELNIMIVAKCNDGNFICPWVIDYEVNGMIYKGETETPNDPLCNNLDWHTINNFVTDGLPPQFNLKITDNSNNAININVDNDPNKPRAGFSSWGFTQTSYSLNISNFTNFAGNMEILFMGVNGNVIKTHKFSLPNNMVQEFKISGQTSEPWYVGIIRREGVNSVQQLITNDDSFGI